MAKFNEVQKRRRAKLGELKRIRHGDPVTAKLKNKPQPVAVSGKRKRKLFKKWRRDQKEAVEQGLITMQLQDEEMAAAEGNEKHLQSKHSPKFNVKKKSLKVKKLKGKVKKKGSAKPATEVSVDSMVE